MSSECLFPHTSEVACEQFLSLLLLLPSLMRGRFGSTLCLCLCLSDEDDRLWNREEALRRDDAIMDFQWFSTVPWAEIKNLRGTTYVQPPARLRCAMQWHMVTSARRVPDPSPPCADSSAQCCFCRCDHPTTAHGVLSLGASTLKILWIARSHHGHMDTPAALLLPNPVTSLPPTVSAAPAAPAVVMFAQRCSILHHCRHQVSRVKLP